MENLYIVVVSSSFEHIEKLNDRLYFDIIRDGYHNLVTEHKDGVQQSLTIFKNLSNKDLLMTLLSGYEYLNDTTIFHGKVVKLEKYTATEYTGNPTRIKVFADNNLYYDIPENAEEHLGIVM